jgi:small subunit ribosomal protein S20
MANIRSQIKRNRTNEKRRQRNRAVKSELRTRVKGALAFAGDEERGEEALRTALKKIDKAASKGVIHKNAAARRKSRLVKAVARSTSA